MEITIVGVDVAKHVSQVHGVDSAGRAALRRKLQRAEVEPFFRDLPRCTVALEACGAAHHWARLIGALGHEVRLLPAEAVRPFVKRGRKNDAADAAALVEAARRQEIRTVPVKSAEQQGVLALHAARALVVKQRTMLANALRGLAAEFGHVVPQGKHRIEALVQEVAADPAVPEAARAATAALWAQLQALRAAGEDLERQIAAHAKADPVAHRLASIPGLGPVAASLIAASVGGNAGAFRRGRDFAAWLGLVPRQHSTGGKTKLGRITKAGNTEIRRLLVLGATAMLRLAPGWNSALGRWVRTLLERKPARLVSVALANKLARIAWAVMTHGESYRPGGRAAAAPATA